MSGARAPGSETLPRAPLWVAGVVLVALCAWWPLDPYWQSDDFLAVTYAQDPHHVVHDFVGPQYGARALVVLYRPLITLAFGVEGWIAGAEPFLAHMSNVLAHALSTLLVTLLAQRLLGARTGLGVGLLWGVWPTHAGSIVWAVGRVDSHTTVWILLTLWATVRWLDRGRGRALAVAAFVLALLSKELAFVVPALAGGLGFVLATPGDRVRSAWRASWPLGVTFAVYLPLRFTALGQVVGGYQDARFPLAESLAGLGTWCARIANPLIASPTAGVAGDAAAATNGAAAAAGVFAASALPLLLWPLALVLAARRGRTAAALACLAWFALCAIPTAPFWSETAEVKSVRYFYLPATGLLALLALGGRWSTALGLLLATVPLVQVRARYLDAHRTAAALHQQLRAADAVAPPATFLVHGLPREDPSRQVLLFHLFVDRLLLPPFGTGRAVLALRPLVNRPGAEHVPLAHFAGLTDFRLLDLQAPEAPPPPPSLPDLPVQVVGSLHLSSLAIWDLHLGRAVHALHFPGTSAPHFRLTILTAGGYVASVLPNEAPGAATGVVSLGSLLARGRYASTGDDAMVALALNVPAAIDLRREFPLLVEAGRLVGGEFEAAARTERPLALRLDEDYCRWLVGQVPDPREGG